MATDRLINLILLFFAYAFLGWCIEVTLKYFQFHRFINRGFLTGPWLPIYGSGAALITVVIKGLAPLEFSVGTTFIVSFLLCGFLKGCSAEAACTVSQAVTRANPGNQLSHEKRAANYI